MMNPWDIKSLYDIQFFVCPSCIFKDSSKQNIIYHAYKFHPESTNYLDNINDDSLTGMIIPWKLEEYKKFDGIKKEEFNDDNDTYDDNYFDDFDGIDPSMIEVCPKSEFVQETEKYKTEPIFKELSNDKNKKLLSCEECQKRFSTTKSLRKHISCFHKEKNFKCEICNKTFSRINTLEIHIKSAHEGMKKEEKFGCNNCGKLFAEGEDLKLHVKSIHETTVKVFKCEKCSKVFTNEYNMRRHVRTFHDDSDDNDTDNSEDDIFDDNGINHSMKSGTNISQKAGICIPE